MSEGCAESLGDSVGFDWGSFGAPRAVGQPSSVGDLFIASLYAIVGTDLGTIAELEAALDPLELVAADLATARDLWNLDAEDPAARFWFGWLTERVDLVALRDPDESGARMGYLSGLVNVYLTWPATGADGLEPTVASVLNHEASHEFAPDHIGTDEFPYDADASGAYAVGARWLYEWMARNLDSAAAKCPLLVDELSDTCVQIADDEGFAPCQGGLVCDTQADDR